MSTIIFNLFHKCVVSNDNRKIFGMAPARSHQIMGIIVHGPICVIVDPIGPVSQGINCNLDAISPRPSIGLYGDARLLLVGPYDILHSITIPTELASVFPRIVNSLFIG